MAEQAQPHRERASLPVVALINQKGGSGKTTTCLNLAGALVDRGQRILMVDLDPQASLTTALDMAPLRAAERTLSHALLQEGGSIVQAVQPTSIDRLSLVAGDPHLRQIELAMGDLSGRELRLRQAIARAMSGLRGAYDYLLIDCPPALGYLTLNAITAATDVLLPVNLDKMAMSALSATLSSVARVRSGPNPSLRVLGILPTQVNMRTKIDQARAAHLRQLYGSQVFETTIPASVQVKEAIEMAQPVTHYVRRGVIVQQYYKLVDEILAREALYA